MLLRLNPTVFQFKVDGLVSEMSAPYPEARGDWPPLPPRFSDGRLPSFNRPLMSETVPSWGFPSNVENPVWNNRNIVLHDHELGCRLLPAWPGIGFNGGRFPGSLNVDCRTGMSNEMKVCRQFQRRGKCAYGDQCRFLHEIPEKTRDFGSSNQSYVDRTVASGHVMDRRSGIDQLEEVRSKVQTQTIGRIEIPKPANYKTKPCFPWQTTGHCPYGEGCRFAHGESEVQKLESCSASSERGIVGGGTSATTSATALAGLRGSRESETDSKNTGPRMKQFFKSKQLKKLIGIYADWLDD